LASLRAERRAIERWDVRKQETRKSNHAGGTTVIDMNEIEDDNRGLKKRVLTLSRGRVKKVVKTKKKPRAYLKLAAFCVSNLGF
jgi:hypothetical protein